jgi:FkbM family methyltransferase
MKFLKNAKTLVSNPAMRSAYLRWTLAKLTFSQRPRLKLNKNVSLGGWLNFSEYWSFHDAVPEPERRFMQQCMQSSRGKAVAFDVGANIGAFTCLLPSLGAGEVHAFEPILETFCRLKDNVAANRLLGVCQLNCLAVGRGWELVTFSIQKHDPAENHLAIANDKSPGGSQRVATISLDAYCQSAGIEKIDFLKVDVEGMEPYVLQGAHGLLVGRKVSAILIEVFPPNLRQVGLTPESLFKEIINVGYAPYELCADGRPGRMLGLSDIETIALGKGNVVLFPL